MFQQQLHKLFTVLLLFAVSFQSQAQNNHQHRNCGFEAVKKHLEENDPTYKANKAQIEKDYQQYLLSEQKNDRNIFRIPVVVHVVYRTNQENISDAQILSQINVLNQDFRRLNADASNTPALFLSAADDPGIEFCLATRDPQGNPTNGITRTQTTVTSFGLNDNMKNDATGGKSPWPRNSYLNIWVCNLGGGLLGYAYPPGASAAVDGVVIGFRFFGTTGTLQAPYNRGRTATHEVGHWLNLEHIWGDDNGSCNGSDQVADTPNQADAYYGCPTFPQVSCGSEDMFMNYMDYTDDACMNIFTKGQRDRMRAVMSGFRASLQNSLGCSQATNPGGGGCDTLMNRALSAYTFLYGAGQSATGYLAGHNSYRDRAKAERFTGIPTDKQLVGARMRFGVARFAGANSRITVKAWASSNNLPGAVLAQKDVFINQISTTGFTNVNFDSPINVSGNSVFIGFEMTYANGDTVALVTSEITTTGNNTAFEQFENGQWFAFDNSGSWGVNASLAIQAVFCSPLSTEEIVSSIPDFVDIYPNPSSGLFNIAYQFDQRPELLQIRVFSLSGKLVWHSQLKAEGSNVSQIDLQGHSNGIYIIEVAGSKAVTRKKIVLQN
ncbi:MAG: M43 family zinc metalloprotease [Flavobacteriales bacterium]